VAGRPISSGAEIFTVAGKIRKLTAITKMLKKGNRKKVLGAAFRGQMRVVKVQIAHLPFSHMCFRTAVQRAAEQQSPGKANHAEDLIFREQSR